MKNCSEIDGLVTPFVDGEAAPADQTAVAAHLGKCPPCRRHADAEQSVRALVRTQADGLISPAPPRLRDRCSTTCRSTGASRALARFVRRPLALAAALALAAVGTLVVGSMANPAAATAAQLTLDHAKCFGLFDQPDSLEPARVRASLRDRYGWDIDIPVRDRAGSVDLVGGRRCVYLDGSLAHLLYRTDGVRVSVFVLPEGRTLGRPGVEFMGHAAVSVERGGRTWVVLARRPRADVARFAAEFGAVTP